MKKIRAPKNPQSQNFNDISINAQCSRILEGLVKAGNRGLTTLDCRERLNVLHPAGRILELREEGHEIITRWDKDIDHNGYIHRVARYVLVQQARRAA